MKKYIDYVESNAKYHEREDFKEIVKKTLKFWPDKDGFKIVLNSVCVTWHWLSRVMSYLSEENLTLEQFLEDLKDVILSNFDKSQFIFKLGGFSWFDNFVWKILADNNYYYEVIVPDSDEFWCTYWTEQEKKDFEYIKSKAIRVRVLLWADYRDRNRVLAWSSSCLFSFIQDYESGTEQTISMFIKNTLTPIQSISETKGKNWIDFRVYIRPSFIL